MRWIIFLCFYTRNGGRKTSYLVFKSSKEKYICLVKYQYTTGAGYYCVKSNNKNFENMYMIIQSKFDPRFLKDNNDFSLDYNAEYLA